MTATADRDRNLETADRLTRAAAADGTTLIVLPEKWSAYGAPEVAVAGAERLDGPALTWARSIARELGVDLIAGSIPEAQVEGERGSNTSIHIGPDGKDRAVYRKLHMFDVRVGGVEYRESEREAAGSEIVVSEAADGTRLGLSICYDLRFPELFRQLAVDGALVVALPSAFTVSTTRDHWEILIRARAIENQCFLIAPNQVGEHSEGVRSGGHSMIVDPWGVVLAQAGPGERFIAADLDFERLRRIRTKLPSLANRRVDVYG